MSPVAFLAVGAATFGLASALAMTWQARALRREGRACEISIALLAVWTAGYAVWVAYGVALANLALVVVNFAGALGAAVTLVVAVRLRRTNPCGVPGRSRPLDAGCAMASSAPPS